MTSSEDKAKRLKQYPSEYRYWLLCLMVVGSMLLGAILIGLWWIQRAQRATAEGDEWGVIAVGIAVALMGTCILLLIVWQSIYRLRSWPVGILWFGTVVAGGSLTKEAMGFRNPSDQIMVLWGLLLLGFLLPAIWYRKVLRVVHEEGGGGSESRGTTGR